MNLLYIILFTWAFVGSIYYIFMLGKVKKQPQKIALLFASGPIIWFILPMTFFTEIFFDKVLLPIQNWLTKE